jgi:hypothetical protein
MADKGIRVNVNNKFVELLAERATTGNTRFRANVIGYAMEEFGITLASAATHYNHAFKEAKKVPELAELLAGLGRAEDKKGGRKPKAKVEAAVAEAVAEVQQTEFTVKRKSDGAVIAEALSFEAAQALVAKAIAAKKSKLYWV